MTLIDKNLEKENIEVHSLIKLQILSLVYLSSVHLKDKIKETLRSSLQEKMKRQQWSEN